MIEIKIHTIGEHVAEYEADILPYYYLENEYYYKALTFSPDDKELFFIGRTGSGKSAILEMVKRKEYDAKRVLSITSDDFAAGLLLSHPEIVTIPAYLKPLVFKSLWKYIIISNIIKLIYGSSESKWELFLDKQKDKGYELLLKFDELMSSQRSLTDQVISFIKAIRTINGIDSLDKAEASSKLYDIFKIVFSFEKNHLLNHIKNNYLHILIDDLDKNWTGKEENVELIRSLFECIIELSRRFSSNLKFVVVLRTDIFSQINFHQTEKIRPYVIEIKWNYHQLKALVEKRIQLTSKIRQEKAWTIFPRNIRIGQNEIRIFDYLFNRTLWRPRDIISFINLCINEAKRRRGSRVERGDVLRAESIYSRQRMEALVDEWKYVYPNLRKWIDLFAGGKQRYSIDELEKIFKGEQYSAESIVDVLYIVGFLGFRSPHKKVTLYSFSSNYATPLIDCDFFVNRAFVSYLRERGEELGMKVVIDDKTEEEEVFQDDLSEADGDQGKINMEVEMVRVLAIFANPRGSDALRLGEEDRVLNECIKIGKLRDSIILQRNHAAQIHDMRRALLENEYDIVHFSGHGTGRGLAFEDADGNVQVIPQKALADLLAAYSPPLKCAILNACYTDNQGRLISQGVPYTIVMNGAISDKAAIEFTRGFYDAISAGKDIDFAYEEGCRCISLAGLPEKNKPILIK